MTVYVDDMEMQAKVPGVRSNARWSHLMADTEAELVEFAVDVLGLRPEWIQDAGDSAMVHFDVTLTVKRKALRAGAVEITWREAGKWAVARRRGEDYSPAAKNADGRLPFDDAGGNP